MRRLVRFAVAEIDMDRVCVNVKNGALGGGAYNGIPEISNAPRAADYLVTLRLGNGRERWPLGPVNYHFKRPDETGPRNRFPFFVCHDWEEWLVKLDRARGQAHRAVPERIACSEISCERFAVAKLEEFRALRTARQEAATLPPSSPWPCSAPESKRNTPREQAKGRRRLPPAFRCSSLFFASRSLRFRAEALRE